MNKLVILAGLPGSGKTTFAQTVTESSRNWVHVSKDDLRRMVGQGRAWDLMDEAIVNDFRDICIISALIKGRSVICDDTNLKRWVRTHLANLADVLGVPWEIQWFSTPIEECIRRDALRHNPVGEARIMDMYLTMERED